MNKKHSFYLLMLMSLLLLIIASRNSILSQAASLNRATNNQDGFYTGCNPNTSLYSVSRTAWGTAVGENGAILMQTDGITWLVQANPALTPLYSAFMISNSYGTAVWENGTIFRIGVGPQSW